MRILSVLIASLAATALVTPAVAQTVATVIDNGDPAELYDIVVIGDGYRAVEQSRFDSDVQRVIAEFQRTRSAPFDSMMHCYNVHTVFRPSLQSGADDPAAGVSVNTAYDSSYGVGGVQRCLYLATNAGRSLAAADAALAPDSDGRIMVLVNSSQYGGCAATFSVSYNGSLLPEVQVHEWGHSFTGLADEYDTGQPGSYFGPEFTDPNVTNSPTGNKWSAWLGHAGPNGTVGAYQGANYYQFGVWRPEPDCLMRNLGSPFCSVCREAVTLSFHQTCQLAHAPVPDTGFIGGAIAGSAYRISFSNRLANRPHTIEWRVDQGPWQPGTTTFDWDTTNAALGRHTITARLRGTSPDVRVDPLNIREHTLSWQVDVDTAAGHADLTGLGDRMVVCSAGDIDGDGFDEFAVGSPDAEQGGVAVGAVSWYSPRFGVVIGQRFGTVPGGEFGITIDRLGNADADSTPDLVVGSTFAAPTVPGGRLGRANVVSGGTRQILFSTDATTPGSRPVVAGVGDLNGDGYDDYALGADGVLPTGSPVAGSVLTASGFDGSVFWSVPGASTTARIGTSIAGRVDFSNDGLPDVAVGMPFDQTRGQVLLLRGTDGLTLRVLTNQSSLSADGYGTSIDLLDDYDGDGAPDVLVGAPRTGAGSGLVLVTSTTNSSTLAVFPGLAGQGLGGEVHAAGDIDGDSQVDFLLRGDELNGAGSAFIQISGPGTSPGWPGPWQSFVPGGDFDGDGYPELLGAMLRGEDAFWFDLGATGTPGGATIHGLPCPGSRPDALPRIGSTGFPRLGQQFSITLRGAFQNAPSALMFGAPTNIPLDLLGFIGCALYVNPVFSVPSSTRAPGTDSLTLDIPMSPALLGGQIELQWAFTDPFVPYAALASLSDAMRFDIGQ